MAGEGGALRVNSKQSGVSDADLYLWWKLGLGPQVTEQHGATRSRFSGEQESICCSPGPPTKSQWLVTVYNEQMQKPWRGHAQRSSKILTKKEKSRNTGAAS